MYNEQTIMSKNKFIQNLTANSNVIKENRANLVAKDAEDAAKDLITRLEKEDRELERREIALSDMYPDSELSLRIGKDNFNADSWWSELQNLGISRINKSVEIKIAKENFAKWFVAEEEVA